LANSLLPRRHLRRRDPVVGKCDKAQLRHLVGQVPNIGRAARAEPAVRTIPKASHPAVGKQHACVENPRRHLLHSVCRRKGGGFQDRYLVRLVAAIICRSGAELAVSPVSKADQVPPEAGACVRTPRTHSIRPHATAQIPVARRQSHCCCHQGRNCDDPCRNTRKKTRRSCRCLWKIRRICW
jgi:hypothetical protein